MDGVATDLGAATVNADGTFDFSDLVGTHTQGFITATATDRAGNSVAAEASYALEGGLGRSGRAARQDTYAPGGEDLTARTAFGPGGRRSVSVHATGQTVDLGPFGSAFGHGQGDTTFVFAPGDGLDVVHGFKLGDAGHDTVELPASDFRNFAAVLRNTGDVGGSAVITDPRTGDALRLAGVTTAELKAHPKDFTFGN